MFKIFILLFNLTLKCHREQVLERAGGLTFRVLLAFFPFIVFLMALMGFLNLDAVAIMNGLYDVLPNDIAAVVERFVIDLSETRSRGVLSAALFFSIYNTTNGFRAIMRCVNMTYGIRDSRSFVKQVWVSFVLMILFTGALVVMLGLLVFGRQIWGLIFPGGNDLIIALSSGGMALIVLVFTTMLIYRLACAQKLPVRYVLPGAIFTVLAWVVASSFFGFITQNFTQYPVIYGSIAGVFILILWLNIVSVLLLVGNEFNSVLGDYF